MKLLKVDLQACLLMWLNYQGFQKIFSTLVSGVGASVQSGDLSLEALSANRDAAMEAEASFSGVNLDTEAAALLEFQQAYQASARLIQTANQLFDTIVRM